MKRIPAVCFFLLAAGLLLPALTGVCPAAGAESGETVDKPRVLVLHAYHVGFTWADHITEGIRKVFLQRAPEVELLFEYMDEKRRSDDAYFQSLHRFLHEKYTGQKIDCIIVSDDRALEFILGRGRDLFPGVPAVFCGINGYDPSRHQGNGRPLTGVVESIDIRATLETALELHPGTRSVAYVTDASLPGRALKRAAESVFEAYRDRVRFEYIEHRNLEQLRSAVSALEKGTIVLAFIFNRDELGRIWSHEYNLARMASWCSVPIYSVWEFYLGHGIVGGMLTSGKAHGEAAARMALRILGGERAGEIPVKTRSPNRFMFDHAELERFKVHRADLPAGSIVIDEPVSLYQAHKAVVWSAIAFVSALLVIIAFLIRDVRLRRRAEAALAESENRFRSVYKTAPLAFVTWDTTCTIVEWNEQAEALFGWTRDQAVGKSFFDLIVPEEDRLLVEQVVEDLLNGRIEKHVVNRNTTKDGGTLWCEWNNAVLRDKDGRITGAISLGLDITERVQSEKELERHRAHLEELVRERTASLDAKNRELETFTYSVSHDLKAPLRGIDGYSRLLVEEYGENLDGEAKRFLENIRTATLQMNQLIEDLLAFSRMERRDLQRDAIPIEPLVDGLLKERERDLTERGIEVRKALSFEALTSDRQSLRQILGNLLDNAVKFTHREAAPFIEIGGKETGGHWALWVKDNGIGLDAKYRERIFGIFQRLHRTEDYPGTGVGLAIVKKAVERLGGRVRAGGEPGSGAEFHVELPRPVHFPETKGRDHEHNR